MSRREPLGGLAWTHPASTAASYLPESAEMKEVVLTERVAD